MGAPQLECLQGAQNTAESHHLTCAVLYRVTGTMSTPRRRQNRAVFSMRRRG